MHKKVDEIVSVLKDLQKEIKIGFKAEIVGVFGSYAREEQKEGSDADILVRFFEGASLFDFVGLANFLEEKLSLKVDIVPVDTVREEIREDVLKEAIYL